jgi:hypothetical protein
MRVKKSPSVTDLRLSALVTGGIVAALYGVLLPWMKEKQVPLWPFLLAGALWVVALVAPRSLWVVHRGLTKLILIITKLLSYAALTLMFYVIVVPFGMLMRLLHRDPLALAWDRNCPSYGVQSKPTSPERFGRPF